MFNSSIVITDVRCKWHSREYLVCVMHVLCVNGVLCTTLDCKTNVYIFSEINTFQDGVGDSYEENELAGIAHSQDTTANVFDNNVLSQTVVESEARHDDIFKGDNLLTLPHKVGFCQPRTKATPSFSMLPAHSSACDIDKLGVV